MSAGDTAGTGAYSAAPDRAAEVAFSERLQRCIEQRRADGQSLAVLLLNCGVIGRADALWGYHIGDAVRARIVASLRSEVLRPDDFAAELGRDDLACVLSVVEGPQLALLAAEKSLRTMSAPMFLGEEEIYASPSVGVALFPATADSAESLLQQARSACNQARELRGRIALYEEGQISRTPQLKIGRAHV